LDNLIKEDTMPVRMLKVIAVKSIVQRVFRVCAVCGDRMPEGEAVVRVFGHTDAVINPIRAIYVCMNCGANLDYEYNTQTPFLPRTW
jgi:uncharacterized protein with PIN domain